jgi:hypothetical protein
LSCVPESIDRSVSRRALFAALVSSASVMAAACSSPGTTELQTPEGRVLQWEGDDLLVLVSGFQPSYHLGDTLQVNLLVNNQSTKLAEVRLRTKLLGRADQPVVQAEPVQLEVKPEDASSVDQSLPLGRDLLPGDYTLAVEVPPWKAEGRDVGRGATLRATVRLEAPGSS